MNVLIVGASGFLGSQLKRRLDKQKEITVYAPSHKEMDALCYEAVESYLRENDIEYVVHTAANHAGVGTGINKELFFLESNLIMNYNLVKASYQSGVKKFITFGTSCCYNNPSQLVFDESNYWDHKSEISYGTCKRVMLEQLELQSDMKWVYLVPPNLYGPGDHFGEKNTHFIPATIKKFDDAIQSGSNQVVVWGDGSQMRDFLYIEDLVDIIVDAIFCDKYDCMVLNVSTMRDVSIKEIVYLIRETWGCEQVDILWDTSKPTGVNRKTLDNSAFKKISPDFKFTGIEAGIAKIVEWHLNGDCYKA